MEYRNNFAVRFSDLRQKHNLSYASLGEILGISDEAVRLLNHGKRSPSFEILCAIADYFNVSIDYLVGRSDDPERH